MKHTNYYGAVKKSYEEIRVLLNDALAMVKMLEKIVYAGNQDQKLNTKLTNDEYKFFMNCLSIEDTRVRDYLAAMMRVE